MGRGSLLSRFEVRGRRREDNRHGPKIVRWGRREEEVRASRARIEYQLGYGFTMHIELCNNWDEIHGLQCVKDSRAFI